MARAPLLSSDYTRQSLAGIGSLVLTVTVLFPSQVEAVRNAQARHGDDGWAGAYISSELPILYLVFWVAFSGIYCFYTHIVFNDLDSHTLHEVCGHQYRAPARWWHSIVGSTSAESWTISAASVASALTILIATTGQLRGSFYMIILGFCAVAGSWAIMAYSFALRYARIRASGQRMDVPVEDPPLFTDFLTHSILVSTMTGGYARLHTREAWTAQRSHTLLAFAFNTVIVAMSVTLLFGGFAA